MAKFIKGNQLNSELELLFEKAKDYLILISPFIKLHSRFIDILKSKKDEDKLEIIIVFGKNENDITNSITKEDFDFLKEFPNIKIKYEPKLHAKFYSNETSSILSSMNLYDFSLNNNIEFGILTKLSLLEGLESSLFGNIDKEAFNYFNHVIENAETLFLKKPIYNKKLFGYHNKYSHSDIIEDKLTNEFSKHENSKFEEIGFCIRSGVKIPFDLEKPLCKKSYYEWNEYKNSRYRENFCHLTGEESYGDTSFEKPVLNKNWRLVKDLN